MAQPAGEELILNDERETVLRRLPDSRRTLTWPYVTTAARLASNLDKTIRKRNNHGGNGGALLRKYVEEANAYMVLMKKCRAEKEMSQTAKQAGRCFARPACSPVFTQASPNHTLVRDLDGCSENAQQGEI